MSFRINTNIAAMGTLRNLNETNNEQSLSQQRLSTGLRINTAADDPAGLIASEGYRAQITGMNTALANNQDAINFSKTAEGALGEVNRLLNDARGLAVAASNTATLSSSQVQANQDQLNSIVASITRISSNTQFGTKKLLDGTAGVNAQVTNATRIASIQLGNSIGGVSITANAAITINSSTSATRALYTSATLTGGNTLAAGSFSLNGVTFTVANGQDGQGLVNQINNASSQTGVTAVLNAASRIEFRSTKFGSASSINFTDAQGVISASANTIAAVSGTDATANVTVGGIANVLFTGGLNSKDGLTLTDATGNVIALTEAGNATTTSGLIGQVQASAAQFQIGGNVGQTASLSLGNFASSQLGVGVASGYNLSNLSLSSATNANTALTVIDKAIEQVSQARGQIGSFQRNVLESNVRALGIAKENLSATDSSIRDTDIADEMTRYTKYQILSQAGLSVLAQANQGPQSVLSLLKG